MWVPLIMSTQVKLIVEDKSYPYEDQCQIQFRIGRFHISHPRPLEINQIHSIKIVKITLLNLLEAFKILR